MDLCYLLPRIHPHQLYIFLHLVLESFSLPYSTAKRNCINAVIRRSYFTVTARLRQFRHRLTGTSKYITGCHSFQEARCWNYWNYLIEIITSLYERSNFSCKCFIIPSVCDLPTMHTNLLNLCTAIALYIIEAICSSR